MIEYGCIIFVYIENIYCKGIGVYVWGEQEERVQNVSGI